MFRLRRARIVTAPENSTAPELAPTPLSLSESKPPSRNEATAKCPLASVGSPGTGTRYPMALPPAGAKPAGSVGPLCVTTRLMSSGVRDAVLVEETKWPEETARLPPFADGPPANPSRVASTNNSCPPFNVIEPALLSTRAGTVCRL